MDSGGNMRQNGVNPTNDSTFTSTTKTTTANSAYNRRSLPPPPLPMKPKHSKFANPAILPAQRMDVEVDSSSSAAVAFAITSAKVLPKVPGGRGANPSLQQRKISGDNINSSSHNNILAEPRGKIIASENTGIDESSLNYNDLKARFQRNAMSERGEPAPPPLPKKRANRNNTIALIQDVSASSLPRNQLIIPSASSPSSYQNNVTPNANSRNIVMKPNISAVSRSSPSIEKPDPFAGYEVDDDSDYDLSGNSKDWVDVTDYTYEEESTEHNGKSNKSSSQSGAKTSKLNPTRWGRSMSTGNAQSSKRNNYSNPDSSSSIEEKLYHNHSNISGSTSPPLQSHDVDSSSSSDSIDTKYTRPINQVRSLARNHTTGGIDLLQRQRRSYSENSEYSIGTTSSSITLVEEDEQTRESKRRRKLWNSIKELVDTERVYLADMKLLETVYYTQAKEIPIFNQYDLKTIFNNLPEVINFSSTFLEMLSKAAGIEDSETDDVEKHIVEENDDTSIGEKFLFMLRNTKTAENSNLMEEVYGEYCKRHEASVAKLQEYENDEDKQSFLQKCKEQCEGQTRSWDISSLLIKPVQRVLKYPLLLHVSILYLNSSNFTLEQIFSLTKPTHPDFKNLKEAFSEVTMVAERINEIKRRKDIVEKIVGSKKKTDADIKHVTGIAKATEDQFYDACVKKFKKWEGQGQKLSKDIREWLKSVRLFFEQQEEFASSLYDFYDCCMLDDEQKKRPTEYRKIVADLASCGKEMEEATKKLLPRIDSFMELFKAPAAVMRKRDRKILDYDRAKAIKARGDTPDKTLQQSAAAFESIRDQLQEELPKFFELMGRYFDIILREFSEIQARFYRQMGMEFSQFFYKYIDPEALEYVSDDRKLVLRNIDVQTEYLAAFLGMDDKLEKFVLIGNHGVTESNSKIKPKKESEARRGRSSSLSDSYSTQDSESSRRPGKTLHRSVSQDGRLAVKFEEHSSHTQRMSYHSNSSLSLSDDIRKSWNVDGTSPFIEDNNPFDVSTGQIYDDPERINGHRKYATDSALTSLRHTSQSTIVADDEDYEFAGKVNISRYEDYAFIGKDNTIIITATNTTTNTTYDKTIEDEDEDDEEEVYHDTRTGEEEEINGEEGGKNVGDKVLFVCYALRRHKSKDPRQLSFKVNQPLEVTHIHEEEKNLWWLCINMDTGERGWVDPKFCKKFDD
ncbi:4457_t:CDS:10 [Ambispora gerdemannii]|uniref:4457_t:CDS:1 n=1 Tax=Ambispora gerdemannii TaxID=144530 RepID=A0A9N9BRM2_9GLOM|nr:4457_t:CDS:10 [Ambispora gerdemannii]